MHHVPSEGPRARRGAGASGAGPRCKSYFTAAAESNLSQPPGRRASVASALASGERAAVPPARADAQGAAVAMPLAQRESATPPRLPATKLLCRRHSPVQTVRHVPNSSSIRSAHRFAGR